MKKYSENIQKLYEAVGFEKIEAGKNYMTNKGGNVIVESIFIDATQESPETFATYKFELADGETGRETNKFNVLVDMIRNK